MDIGRLIYNLPHNVKNTIRKIEKTQKKLVNNQSATVFNQTCLQENILPTYTNIRTHDPAARSEHITMEYRKKLLQRQIRIKEEEELHIQQQLRDLRSELSSYNLDADLKQNIEETLEQIQQQARRRTQSSTVKKLNILYRGRIFLPNQSDGFINLSRIILSDKQKEVLNLGLNCHYQPKFDKLDKKAELEILYDSLLKLEEKGKLSINPDLQEQLQAESTKCRSNKGGQLLSKELREAAKELKNTPGLVIRRADKSSIYVLINEEEYKEKLNNLLNDTTKFKTITRDPTEKLKTKVNKLISTVNAASGQVHIPPIVGEYSPGYIYGNVKTHKPNNPLRPIISQVTTPTYKLAKQINQIITPYMPTKFSLKSTDEFIDILRTTKPEGILASLDVESLFTNVPVEETTRIILENVYNHPSKLPPKIPQELLKGLLKACTTEAPFKCPDGKLYYQIEGVSMGSPLGPTYANFYMCDLENKVIHNASEKPKTYCRYVDDIFVVVRNEEQLRKLKQDMEEASILKFTYELSVENKIAFLDVNIEKSDGKYVTTVHRKPTDLGRCLNAKSECPERYKLSVVNAYIKRAYRNCSNWELFHQEIERMKQVLVNNGYSNTIIDQQINKFLECKTTQPEKQQYNEIYKVYYMNQMSPAYKLDERVMENIIKRNVKCINSRDKLNLIIYYKNPKTSNLIMKNNLAKDNSMLKKTNIIYEFQCPEEVCKLHNNIKYVGMTSTSLSRRITMHLAEGGPKKHMQDCHKKILYRQTMVENTRILKYCQDRNKLQVLEAIIIRETKPTINVQSTGYQRILKLYTQGQARIRQEAHVSQVTQASIRDTAVTQTDQVSIRQVSHVSQVTQAVDLTQTAQVRSQSRPSYNLRSQSRLRHHRDNSNSGAPLASTEHNSDSVI